MRTRLQLDYGISSYDAATLTADREIAEYFEAVARN
jgi:aspartyl-tRNA(Asn)/glutamyl-tRNA(Gln) amidotransferase subunit B